MNIYKNMNSPFPVSSKLPVVVFLTAILLNMAGCAISGFNPVDYYALVYGVNDYGGLKKPDPDDESTWRDDDLTYSGPDGEDMRKLLGSMGYTILNEDTHTVNYRDVKADFAKAAALVDENDIFLFYFSGHGAPVPDSNGVPAPDSKDVFIVMTDMIAVPQKYVDQARELGIIDNDQTGVDSEIENDTGDTTKVKIANIWTPDALNKEILALQAFHHILILDACRSGGFIDDSDNYGVDSLPDSIEYPLNLEDDNWVDLFLKFDDFSEKKSTPRLSVMVASGVMEDSYEPAPGTGGKNGIFTSFLLEAAETHGRYRKADFNLDGVVTLSEAYSHIFTRIEETVNIPQHTGYRQSGVPTEFPFYPHLSGGSLDPVLFPAP